MIRARPIAAALAAATLAAACAGGKEPPVAKTVPAAPADAARPSTPDLWRERARAPAELPAGTLVRVASRRPIDRGGECPPAELVGKPAEAQPQPAARPECPSGGDEVEEVEIDWHALPPPP